MKKKTNNKEPYLQFSNQQKYKKSHNKNKLKQFRSIRSLNAIVFCTLFMQIVYLSANIYNICNKIVFTDRRLVDCILIADNTTTKL